MITVEKALKDNKTRKAVEGSPETKKKNGKKLLIVAGIGLAAFIGWRMLKKKGSDEKVSGPYQ